MNKIIFPGSFDPITIGHVDLIKRASLLYDEVIVVVTENQKKKSFIDVDTRIELINGCIKELRLHGITVDKTNKMMVDYCVEKKCYVVLRGLRNTTDLAFEHNLSFHNENLNEKVETICLLTKQKYLHISSSAVREILSYNKSIKHLVPNFVEKYFKEK